MTGIIGAMKIEIEALNAQMENRQTRTVSGIEFTSGTLCGREVVTAVCGIGKVFAAMCAQTMILICYLDRRLTRQWCARRRASMRPSTVSG